MCRLCAVCVYYFFVFRKKAFKFHKDIIIWLVMFSSTLYTIIHLCVMYYVGVTFILDVIQSGFKYLIISILMNSWFRITAGGNRKKKRGCIRGLFTLSSILLILYCWNHASVS